MEITVAQTRAPVPPDLRWPGDGTFRVWRRVVICRKQTIRAFNMPGSVHSNTRHARMYLCAVNEPGSEWKAPGNALELQRVWAGRQDSLQNTSHSRPNAVVRRDGREGARMRGQSRKRERHNKDKGVWMALGRLIPTNK